MITKKQLVTAQSKIEKALDLMISARDILGKSTYTTENDKSYEQAIKIVELLGNLNSKIYFETTLK